MKKTKLTAFAAAVIAVCLVCLFAVGCGGTDGGKGGPGGERPPRPVTEGDVCIDIVINQMPTKLIYKEGEKFSPKGMKFDAVYVNGYTGDKNLVSGDLDGFTKTPLVYGDTFATVKFEGFEKQIEITVLRDTRVIYECDTMTNLKWAQVKTYTEDGNAETKAAANNATERKYLGNMNGFEGSGVRFGFKLSEQAEVEAEIRLACWATQKTLSDIYDITLIHNDERTPLTSETLFSSGGFADWTEVTVGTFDIPAGYSELEFKQKTTWGANLDWISLDSDKLIRTVIIECEDMKCRGAAMVKSDIASASGGKYVGQIHSFADSGVEFVYNAAYEVDAVVYLRFAGWEAEQVFTEFYEVTVLYDGESEPEVITTDDIMVKGKGFESFVESKVFSIKLKKGANTIKIVNKEGSGSNMDYVKLEFLA